MDTDGINHPIFDAARNGDLEQVERYIEEDGHVDIKDESRSTPLIAACWDGHLEVVELLVESGADIDAQYSAGNTPLIVASWCGHLEVVAYLVDRGADIHVKNLGGDDALHWAAEHGNLAIVELLVEAGADVNSPNVKGGTPLTHACEFGTAIEVVAYLIGEGAVLDSRADRDGFTPLVAAAYRGNVDVMEALIAAGADIHVDHGAPLEWAALFDQLGAVECLLGAGADPDEKAGHDNTALISAAGDRADQRTEVVAALLEAGARVDERGADGMSAGAGCRCRAGG